MRCNRVINYFLILIIVTCIFVYVLISKYVNFHNYEPTLNGLKLSQLKGISFPPLFPDPSSFLKQMDNRKTIEIPLFTLSKERGIGHYLFELCSLLGLSQKLHRIPILNPEKDRTAINIYREKIRSKFASFSARFEEKTIPTKNSLSINFNIRQCCKFENPAKLETIQDQHLFLNGFFFQSYKYFDHLRSDIRNILKPTQLSFVRAEMMIPYEFRSFFKICIHTKSPQDTTDQMKQPTDPIFTRKATDFLVQKYQKNQNKEVVVVMFGTDPIWSFNIFPDNIPKSEIMVVSETPLTNATSYTVFQTPSIFFEDDIAFSQSYCDAFLLTAPSSSFGWWLAYLSKNDDHIYYRNMLESKDRISEEMREIDYFPTKWNKMSKI